MSKASDKKKAERRKKYEKARNLKANTSRVRYRLDIKMDDGWRIGVMGFQDIDAVNRHIEGAEEMRKRGNVEIAEGFVFEQGSNKLVAHIEPFKPVEPAGMALVDRGPVEGMIGPVGDIPGPRKRGGPADGMAGHG